MLTEQSDNRLSVSQVYCEDRTGYVAAFRQDGRMDTDTMKWAPIGEPVALGKVWPARNTGKAGFGWSTYDGRAFGWNPPADGMRPGAENVDAVESLEAHAEGGLDASDRWAAPVSEEFADWNGEPIRVRTWGDGSIVCTWAGRELIG